MVSFFIAPTRASCYKMDFQRTPLYFYEDEFLISILFLEGDIKSKILQNNALSWDSRCFLWAESWHKDCGEYCSVGITRQVRDIGKEDRGRREEETKKTNALVWLWFPHLPTLKELCDDITSTMSEVAQFVNHVSWQIWAADAFWNHNQNFL